MHSISREERLIVFTRCPEAGAVKTRLIPALGAERAAKLHAALTRHTLQAAEALCCRRSCHVEVRFAGGDATQMREAFGASWDFRPQHGADLGERLAQAVGVAFDEGAKRVLVIGTDCPDLSAEHLVKAFEALSQSDIVLGPAEDGGYYLIGLRRPALELFRGIDFGTERVLRQTLDKAKATYCRVHLLAPLSDVDYPEDLIACRRNPGHFTEVFPPPERNLLSIVIPTWNEESLLGMTLAPLKHLPDVEVIVADGGSTDGTVDLANQHGARVVAARRGRGRQLNAGAAVARGDTLFFLHADSLVPRDFVETIRRLLDGGHVAGAFRLRIDASGWALRCVEWGANWRSRVLQMPYGDQGLFLTADRFFGLGGYPNWQRMEDYELSRRLRRRGSIAIAGDAVTTSARRWRRCGVFSTTLKNQLTILAFYLRR